MKAAKGNEHMTKQNVWLQTMYATMRQLPAFAEASDAQVGKTIRDFLDVGSLDEVQPADYDFALAKISARVEEHLSAEPPAAVVPGWKQDAAGQDAPDEEMPWWYFDVAMSERPLHGDWRVSVTPNARGDYVTPDGTRFNITFHDGATDAEALHLVATMGAAMQGLADIGIKPASRQQAQPAAPKQQRQQSAPPVGARRPADQPAPEQEQGDEGQTIWLDGQPTFGSPGQAYSTAIERVELQQNGDKFSLAFYEDGAEWPLVKSGSAFKNGEYFKIFENDTGLDPMAIQTHYFPSGTRLVFELGRKTGKQNKAGENTHYKNLVGIIKPDGNDDPF